jgi:hypothetical protein
MLLRIGTSDGEKPSGSTKGREFLALPMEDSASKC